MIPHSTDTTNTPPDAIRPQKPRRSYGSAFAAGLFVSALILAALIVLWLGQTSEKVYTDGADALTIRAVLRADTDKVTAEKLAGVIYGIIPDGSVDIINEAMGRSLLALQEPWIARMPDFEVTPLPILLEIHHPDLLTNPMQVAKFVEELGKNPAVDFVAYNETAHDKLVKFARASGKIEKHAVRWLLGAIAVAGFMATFLCARAGGSVSISGASARMATVWAAGWGLAWIIYRAWESAAVSTGDWERIGVGAHISIGLAALIIIAAATLASFALARMRP